MGQAAGGELGNEGTASRTASPDVAHLTQEELSKLQEALKVSEPSPATLVELPAFLACFPSHLRPLVQPLFFLLGRRSGDSELGPFGPEPVAFWSDIAAGISRFVVQGASWPVLLQAWDGGSGIGDDTGSQADIDAAMERAKAGAELSLALCFWCACPHLSPGPGIPDGYPASAVAEAVHGGQSDPVDLILACFWPSESSAWLGEGAGPGRIQAWLVEAAPCLPMSVAPRLQQAFFGLPPQPERKQLESRILDMTQTFLLRGMDSRLWVSDEWQPLYCDWRDGRSFSSFMRGVVHYPGVALVLMRLNRSGIVLGAMGSAWEEGRGKYVGGPDTLLFSLRPSLQVLRTSGKGTNYFYLNSRNKHAPRGLGFGGQPELGRLWVDADFEECHVLRSDATFKAGALIPDSTEFQAKERIAALEVWGCAGAAALNEQSELRAREEGIRASERKVDRSRFVESQFDREMFLGKTFAHNQDKAADT